MKKQSLESGSFEKYHKKTRKEQFLELIRVSLNIQAFLHTGDNDFLSQQNLVEPV